MHHFKTIMACAAVLVMSNAGVAGDLELQLEAIETNTFHESTSESKLPSSKLIRLPEGAPLHLRIRLINASDKESQNISRFIARTYHTYDTQYFLACPDGTTLRIIANRWNLEWMEAGLRTMQPHQTDVVEMWFYGAKKLDLSTNTWAREPSYLFDEPGIYRMHAEYWGIPRTDQGSETVRSNDLVIEIGPSIKNWEDLKAAGIVPAVDARPGTAAAEIARVSKLEALVQDSGDPLLNGWLEERKKHIDRMIISEDGKLPVDLEALDDDELRPKSSSF